MHHLKAIHRLKPKNALFATVLLALTQLAYANGISCTDSTGSQNTTCQDLVITGSHSGVNSGIYFSGAANSGGSGANIGGSGGGGSGGSTSGWTINSSGSLTISGAHISATGTSNWQDKSESSYNQNQPPSALTLRLVNLKDVTIDSGSTLTGVFGVSIQGRMSGSLGAHVDSFTNHGKIEAKGSVGSIQRPTGSAGLYIEGINWSNGLTTHIGKITNTGSITSEKGYGILMGHGSKVDAFINEATGFVSGGGAAFGTNGPWTNSGDNELGSFVNKGKLIGADFGLLFSFGSQQGVLKNMVFTGDSITQGGTNGLQFNFFANVDGLIVEDHAKIIGLGAYGIRNTLSVTNYAPYSGSGADIVGLDTGRSDIASTCHGTSICVKDHGLIYGRFNGIIMGVAAAKGTLLVTGNGQIASETESALYVYGSTVLGSSNESGVAYTGIKVTGSGSISTQSGAAAIESAATVHGMLFTDHAQLTGGTTAALWVRSGTVNPIAASDTIKASGSNGVDNSFCAGAAICVRSGVTIASASGATTADAIRIGSPNSTVATTINGDIRIESADSLKSGESGYGVGIYGTQTTINGNVILGSGNFTVTNTGNITGSIQKPDAGQLILKDIALTVVPGQAGSGLNDVKKVDVNVGDATKLVVKSVTITQVSDISRVNPSDDISLKDSIAITSNGQVQYRSPEAADISDTLKGLGFGGWYGGQNDPIFHSTYNVGSSAGAVVSQTMANQLFRRDFFLDAALTEAGTGSLYHRRMEGVEGTAFVKPYFSQDTMKVGSGQLTGTTQGLLLGVNRFVGRHFLTTFLGYERSQFDSPYQSSQLNIDAQSWYAGFTTAHLLGATPTLDVFLKGGLKAAYSGVDLSRDLVAVGVSQADTQTVSVGMNVAFGVNWRLAQDTQIIPMVGLGYSVGKTDSYQLDRTGLINDSYMPNRVHIPYADANVTWFQGYNKILRTFVSGGVRQIFKTEQTSTVQFDKNKITGTYELPSTYGYVNVSAVLHMTPQSEVALGYSGVLDEAGHSHNVTMKYELHY